LLFDGGRLLAAGTPAELAAHDREFQRLFPLPRQ
jgi:ABC-type multidrug transport system fused ATPase/permease subunit